MGSELDSRSKGRGFESCPLLDGNNVKVMPGSIPETPDPGSKRKKKEIQVLSDKKKDLLDIRTSCSVLSIICKIKFIILISKFTNYVYKLKFHKVIHLHGIIYIVHKFRLILVS